MVGVLAGVAAAAAVLRRQREADELGGALGSSALTSLRAASSDSPVLCLWPPPPLAAFGCPARTPRPPPTQPPELAAPRPRRLHASRPLHPGQHDTRDRRGCGLHRQVPAHQGTDERAAAANVQPEPAGAVGRWEAAGGTARTASSAASRVVTMTREKSSPPAPPPALSLWRLSFPAVFGPRFACPFFPRMAVGVWREQRGEGGFVCVLSRRRNEAAGQNWLVYKAKQRGRKQEPLRTRTHGTAGLSSATNYAVARVLFLCVAKREKSPHHHRRPIWGLSPWVSCLLSISRAHHVIPISEPASLPSTHTDTFLPGKARRGKACCPLPGVGLFIPSLCCGDGLFMI